MLLWQKDLPVISPLPRDAQLGGPFISLCSYPLNWCPLIYSHLSTFKLLGRQELEQSSPCPMVGPQTWACQLAAQHSHLLSHRAPPYHCSFYIHTHAQKHGLFFIALARHVCSSVPISRETAADDGEVKHYSFENVLGKSETKSYIGSSCLQSIYSTEKVVKLTTLTSKWHCEDHLLLPPHLDKVVSYNVLCLTHSTAQQIPKKC